MVSIKKVDVLTVYFLLLYNNIRFNSFDSGYWGRVLYLLLARMNMGRKLQLLPWLRVPPLLTIAISYLDLTRRFGKM